MDRLDRPPMIEMKEPCGSVAICDSWGGWVLLRAFVALYEKCHPRAPGAVRTRRQGFTHAIDAFCYITGATASRSRFDREDTFLAGLTSVDRMSPDL